MQDLTDAQGMCSIVIRDHAWVGLSDAENLVAKFPQLRSVDNRATVEEESGLLQVLVHRLVVESAELIPLSQDRNGVGTLGGVPGRFLDVDELREPSADGLILNGGAKVREHLLLGHLGIVDVHVGTLLHEGRAHVDRRRLARVTSVLLEGKPEHSDLLAADGVEHSLDHFLRKAATLVVVDFDHAQPVPRDLLESHGGGEVHQVQNVLLEARASETDRRLQKLRPDAGVTPDRPGNLVNVGSGGLTHGGDGVDGGDTLGEEGVGDEFGKFGAPQVRGEDPLLWHPVLVHRREQLHRRLALLVDVASDQHPVRLQEILHGGTLGQELRVRKDRELRCGVL
eukprot:Hpha_TRINITY_DN15462_c0_g9::TRINITY_DN15462_c0_g9_i1::g.175677::m.175677